MPLRKLILPFAFLVLLGFVPSVWADDANIQMTTANGTTLFGFQDSTGKDIVTVNSAGVLLVSSNTILPGTTFYQNGNVNLGSSGDVITMPIVTISSNAVLPGATFYQNGSIVLGAVLQSVKVSSNTILQGATFYQNGSIAMGVTAQSVKFSSNVVVGSNATFFQNGNIAVSSATFNGFAQLLSTTNTALHAITPSAVGQLYYCNNCAAASVVCVSTGTTVGAFGEIESKTTACN